MNKIYGEVYTINEIYGYVNDGTDGHIVAPKNKPFLAFQPNYTAKTSPSRISARAGGAKGGYVYTRKGHYVKGIKAREFDKQIAKLRKESFENDMGEALDDLLEV